MKQILLELLLQKRRILISLGILLLVNCLLGAFVAYYQKPALKEAQKSWNSLRSRLAVIGRGDVSAVYRQGKSDLDKLAVMIPVRRQFPRLLGDILDAAASSGVAVGTMTYLPKVVKDENLLAYHLSMTVYGHYAALKSLLSDIQKNREFIVIDGVSLSNADPFEENVSMDIQLTLYLREGS